MDKKLPKVYANKIEKDLNNNEKVYYSSHENNERVEKKEPKKNTLEEKYRMSTDQNIVQKIHSIFNSPKYVYKADVEIELKSGKVSKKIIGKNATHLITMDNELIPISEVIDIHFSE